MITTAPSNVPYNVPSSVPYYVSNDVPYDVPEPFQGDVPKVSLWTRVKSVVATVTLFALLFGLASKFDVYNIVQRREVPDWLISYLSPLIRQNNGNVPADIPLVVPTQVVQGVDTNETLFYSNNVLVDEPTVFPVPVVVQTGNYISQVTPPPLSPGERGVDEQIMRMRTEIAALIRMNVLPPNNMISYENWMEDVRTFGLSVKGKLTSLKFVRLSYRSRAQSRLPMAA